MGRNPLSFVDVSIIALELLHFRYEFEEGAIICNQAGSVKTEEKLIFSVILLQVLKV